MCIRDSDGTVLQIAVDAAAGETVWNSMAALEVEAPRFVIRDIEFIDGDFEPGIIRLMNVEVTNIGRKATGGFHAVLSSPNAVVTIIENEADYDDIEPGRTGSLEDSFFRIRSHPFTIPGSTVELVMAIETEGGFRDTTDFTFNIGTAGEGDPFGPDDYGYVCFDSEDEGWEMTPVYEWVEIDPDERNNDFDGENTGLRDNGEDSDRSAVVELPFDFQYYGEDFQSLTICTNGWAAFGRWNGLSDFRSRRIASGGGPNAQLCVFWDNLTTGKILTYYDEEGGRFIVEWNDMHRQWGGGGSETFELILYDQQLHPTYTGDGIIQFQYKEISNASGGDLGNNDTPYATVGIGNLDDTDGLEYTYWNTYHPAATHLHNELAIKFTTAVEFITGVLKGTVRDAATGDPIPGAQITTSRGFWDETDENGEFFIDEILIGDGYILNISAPGYNDTTWAGENGEGFSIAEDETLSVDFALLHPEFTYDVERFRFQMNADDSLESGFTLRNTGNGTLFYTSRFTYVLGDDSVGAPGRDEMWDPLLVWTAGDSVEDGDTKLQGVAFVEDHWIVAGGGSGRRDENWFYRFDRWGHYIDRFPQPIEDSRYGLRDMVYHDGYLYCAFPDENAILKVDPENGEQVARWETPRRLRTPTNITIDNQGYFWISSITTDIFKLELVGDTALVEVENFRSVDPRDPTSRIRANGLAWFRDDPDQYNLYIISNNAPMDDPDGVLPSISIYKMSPIDGDIRFLTNLPSFERGCNGRGGLCITPKWNNLVWAIAAVIDNSNGDRVGVMELAPNSSWIDYSPRSDTLEAGEEVNIDLLITTADLDTGRYGVVIEFDHNAAGGVTRIPVDLIITILATDDGGAVPVEYSLEQNWPNPFNPATTIGFGLREAGVARLAVYDMLGREVSVLVNECLPAGRYRVTFDGGDLPAGLYLYRLEAGRFTRVRKMALVK